MLTKIHFFLDVTACERSGGKLYLFGLIKQANEGNMSLRHMGRYENIIGAKSDVSENLNFYSTYSETLQTFYVFWTVHHLDS